MCQIVILSRLLAFNCACFKQFSKVTLELCVPRPYFFSRSNSRNHSSVLVCPVHIISAFGPVFHYIAWVTVISSREINTKLPVYCKLHSIHGKFFSFILYKFSWRIIFHLKWLWIWLGKISSCRQCAGQVCECDYFLPLFRAKINIIFFGGNWFVFSLSGNRHIRNRTSNIVRFVCSSFHIVRVVLHNLSSTLHSSCRHTKWTKKKYCYRS